MVIEADCDQEMPEQMLATVLLSRLQPSLAPPFPQQLASHLGDEANHVPALPRTNNVKRNGKATELTPPASCSASPVPSDGEDEGCSDDAPATLR